MPGASADAGKLLTLISATTFNDATQDEQSSPILTFNYKRLLFFVDITAAGAADDTIELQIYLQAFDGTNWFDVADAPLSAWEYDHSQVTNAPRPGTAQLRECISIPVSANTYRVDVRSGETTAAKTLTLTLAAQAVT